MDMNDGLTNEDKGYIKRICEIILNNNFGNDDLDSYAFWISHHPEIMKADSNIMNKGV
jgi:hypothetical protein